MIRTTYRHSFRNERGDTFQATLPSEGAPLWRQPGEVAEEWVANHESHKLHGPWTLVSTDRAT